MSCRSMREGLTNNKSVASIGKVGFVVQNMDVKSIVTSYIYFR
jgi:hypothetical protein